jgi:hypothetical protein
LWRNPIGIVCGGVALVAGVFCFGHGLWHLVH